MGRNSRKGLGYERRERVGDLLFREIALIISEGKIRDPRISRAVVTSVSLSRDMSCAKVYFTDLKGEPSASMLEALSGLSGFFRKQIALRLALRKVPSIQFKTDEVLRSARRVENILRKSDG